MTLTNSSKKKSWESKFAKPYKRQFENYYHVNYLNREFNVVTNLIQFHKYEENNFIEFVKSTREIFKTKSITIFDFELTDYFNAFVIFQYFAFFILNYWKIQQSFLSKFFAMAKNILTISYVEIEIKRLFNMTKNVITYRCDWFNSNIIEIVMLIKFAALKNSSHENENISFHHENDESYANKLFVKTTKKSNFAWINNDDENVKNVQNEEDLQKQNNDDVMKDLLTKKNVDEIKKMIKTKNVDVIKTMSFNKKSRLMFLTSFSSLSTIIVDISTFKKTQNIFFYLKNFDHRIRKLLKFIAYFDVNDL